MTLLKEGNMDQQEINQAIDRLRKAGKQVDVQNRSGKIVVLVNGKSLTQEEAVNLAKSLTTGKSAQTNR